MAPRKPRADGPAAAQDAPPADAAILPAAAGEAPALAAAADATAAPPADVGQAHQAERAQATAASRIEHDGVLYEPGSPIDLTEAEFERLRPTGALEERTWDECMLTF